MLKENPDQKRRIKSSIQISPLINFYIKEEELFKRKNYLKRAFFGKKTKSKKPLNKMNCKYMYLNT